jgi:MoxR-like ATPase
MMKPSEKKDYYSGKINDLKKEISTVIVGQTHMIDSLIYALLSDGHVLLEGVPGLAKSLAVEILAKALQGKFQRIQFTPDLLPSDISGVAIYNQKTQDFETKKGPIFTNFLLADEINRSSPKVQSALLQAMQEREVNIEKETYQLEKPFMVLATMNPLEQEGTYPLAEAQIDRFMLKIDVKYLSRDELQRLLELKNTNFESIKKEVKKVMSLEDIREIQEVIHESVHVEDRIREYIVSLCINTQPPYTRNKADVTQEELEGKNWVIDYNKIKMGSSPRGAEYIQKVAKVHAFIQGRDYVILDDICDVAKDILRHRIILNPVVDRAETDEESILEEILEKTKLP